MGSESWYDLEHDAVLIEQSIATQYGVLPAAQGELSYTDWAKLLGGLMRDTPLGAVVAVRSEHDREVIRRMSSEQQSLRRDWVEFRANQVKERPGAEKEQLQQMARLEQMMAGLFGR